MQPARTARPQQPGPLGLFGGEEFVVNRIVDHARDQFPILILCQPGRAMFQAERNVEEGKAVSEVGRAVERIHIPPICMLQSERVPSSPKMPCSGKAR